MPRRSITIEEEHGVFRVRRQAEPLGVARTLESALIKSAQRTGIRFVESLNLFEASELLDELMGPRRERDDGPVAA